MKRRLLTLAAIASLVLFVATLALWVRSHHVFEGVIHERERGGRWIAFSLNGRIQIYFQPSKPFLRGRLHLLRDGANSLTARVAAAQSDVLSPEQPAITVPHWGAASVFSLPGLIVITRSTLHRDRAHGTCRHCGYDLRATPQRCPECGSAAGRE